MLAIKSELCRKVLVQESLIIPKDAVSYPLDLTQVTAVNIVDVAQTIKEGKKFVVLEKQQTLRLEELLHFDPYANLGEVLLQELFNEDNPEHHQQITDEFIYRISEHMYDKTDDHITIFKPSPLRLTNLTTPPGDIHKLAQVFRLWKEEMGAKGTCCNLHKKLDQFSVFAGRNPLKVATGICVTA